MRIVKIFWHFVCVVQAAGFFPKVRNFTKFLLFFNAQSSGRILSLGKCGRSGETKRPGNHDGCEQVLQGFLHRTAPPLSAISFLRLGTSFLAFMKPLRPSSWLLISVSSSSPVATLATATMQPMASPGLFSLRVCRQGFTSFSLLTLRGYTRPFVARVHSGGEGFCHRASLSLLRKTKPCNPPFLSLPALLLPTNVSTPKYVSFRRSCRPLTMFLAVYVRTFTYVPFKSLHPLSVLFAVYVRAFLCELVVTQSYHPMAVFNATYHLAG